MRLDKDYLILYIGDRLIAELPHEIELTIIADDWPTQREYHRRVKYVWDDGVGYPERTTDGFTHCSVMSGNVVRFANGTEIVYQSGKTDLVKEVLNAARPELKLAVSDEVEFMDI